MSRKLRYSLFIACLLLVGAGCSFSPPASIPDAAKILNEASSTLNQLPGKDQPFAWKGIAKGVERGEQTTVREGWKIRTIVYKFDPKLFSFRFANASNPKTIRAWRDDLASAQFIINGVYFHEDGTPSGSLRIDGKDLSSRSFDADKSGLIVLDNVPRIIDTSKNEVDPSSVSSSAQSYPFLIKNGAASVVEDSRQIARRSAFGMDKGGNVYMIAYPDGEISLYEFGKLLEALPISWESVLNLDGGPSTSFVSKIPGAEEIEDGYMTIPNVITAEQR